MCSMKALSHGLKVLAKVKVFKKKVKLQGQGHKVKNYGALEPLSLWLICTRNRAGLVHVYLCLVNTC